MSNQIILTVAIVVFLASCSGNTNSTAGQEIINAPSLRGDQKNISPPPAEQQIFCTQNAMQCPDGSWVGRSGAKCEFVCPQSQAK